MKKRIFLMVLFLSCFCISCEKGAKSMTCLTIDFQEGDLPSLHPQDLMIYLRGISIAKTLYEGLTRIDASGKASLAGAKDVKVSPDGLEYTFTLHKNHWSNGSLVTASHYEAAWKRALDPHHPCSRAHLFYVIENAQKAKKGEISLDAVGIKAINDQTLKIKLATPSPYLLELLAHPICAPLFDPKEKTPSVFNGPFTLGSWKKNDSLTLVPNPHFWNKDAVKLDKIEIVFIQDVPTAFAAYEKNEIDWVGLPLCPLTPELIHQLDRHQQLQAHPIDRAFWLFLNTNHPLLSSVKIRQALSLSIDRRQVTGHILIGGKPLLKPIPDALLTSKQGRLEENREKAKKLFQEGLQELGLSEKNIPPLSIAYAQQANRKQFAEYVQNAWKEVLGLPVELQQEEWNVLRTNLEKGDFDMSACFEAAFYKDPLELLERFLEKGPANFPQWTNHQYNNLVKTAAKISDVEKREQLLVEAELLLQKELPFIPICSDRFLFSHRKGLSGYVFDYVGAIDFSYASFRE